MLRLYHFHILLSLSFENLGVFFVLLTLVVFCFALLVNSNKKTEVIEVLPNKGIVHNDQRSESKNLYQPRQYHVRSIEEEQWIFQEIQNLDNRQSLSDLLIIKGIEEIFYGDLLNCFEWRFVRLKVLLRDHFQCERCQHFSESNHIHHTFYIQDHLPWDIDESALQALCSTCHKLVHETTSIPIRGKAQDGSLYNLASVDLRCSRCGGHGYLPQFSHVQAGICFKCYGHDTRNETFRSILITNFEQLSFYNDDQRRSEYKNFLMGLKPEMLKCLKLIKPIKKPKYNDDDLPF